MRQRPHQTYSDVPADAGMDIRALSWGDQINELVRRIERAGERQAANEVMRMATELGFVEEYRPGKWQPIKGKKGRDAKIIIQAYFAQPNVYNSSRKPEEARDALSGLLDCLNELDLPEADFRQGVEHVRRLISDTPHDQPFKKAS